MGIIPLTQQVRLAQLDRAFGYGPKGRGFESSSARLIEDAETLINTVSPLSFCRILPFPFLFHFVSFRCDSMAFLIIILCVRGCG